jgi:hypothetical protein
VATGLIRLPEAGHTNGEAMQDLTQLSDPEFIAERARVRTELEHAPEGTADRAALGDRYVALLAELDRRGSHAQWATAS